jgi:hypothetical protein
MNWPALDEEAAVNTSRLENSTAAKCAAQCWAIEIDAKITVGV